MTQPVEFWFEFASTYSYPAAMRVEHLARDAGVVLRWRAFLLGPIFRAKGWTDSPFNLDAAKGDYMWRDIARICEREGLPFRAQSVFPRNALLPARIACEFAEADWLPAFIRSVYVAGFGEDRDITRADVVMKILERLDLPADIIDRAQMPAAKLRLREQTEEARRRGIFGAPTIFVGDEMFWGNDRLVEAFDHYSSHSRGSG